MSTFTQAQTQVYESTLARLNAKGAAANAGLAKMRESLARKAALAAPKAESTPTPTPAATQPPAPPVPADAMPTRVWRVTLVVTIEGEGERLWACPDVSAPTIKRAVREARSMARSLHAERPVVGVCSVIDRDLVKLPLVK